MREAPSPVPMRMPRTACQKLMPYTETASTPTKIVANSRLGEVHVQKSWLGLPWRSASAMNSLPPGSTAAILLR